MLCVGFEPTIPASEPAKTVHVLDRSATVTGRLHLIPKVQEDMSYMFTGSESP
jgi:hypothetical protein